MFTTWYFSMFQGHMDEVGECGDELIISDDEPDIADT